MSFAVFNLIKQKRLLTLLHWWAKKKHVRLKDENKMPFFGWFFRSFGAASNVVSSAYIFDTARL